MEDDSYFEDEEFSPIKSILGLLTFSTILPINVFTSIECMTKLTWFWPFIHLFIGILAAICGYVSLEILHLNSFFTATIVYAFAISFILAKVIDKLIGGIKVEESEEIVGLDSSLHEESAYNLN